MATSKRGSTATLVVHDLGSFPTGGNGRLVAGFPSPPPPFFVLRISTEEGVVVVEDVEVAVHGSGPTEAMALDEFLAAARAHLDLLEAQEELSPLLMRQRDHLRERLSA
jgi:hypothetical protein